MTHDFREGSSETLRGGREEIKQTAPVSPLSVSHTASRISRNCQELQLRRLRGRCCWSWPRFSTPPSSGWEAAQLKSQAVEMFSLAIIRWLQKYYSIYSTSGVQIIFDFVIHALSPSVDWVGRKIVETERREFMVKVRLFSGFDALWCWWTKLNAGNCNFWVKNKMQFEKYIVFFFKGRRCIQKIERIFQ